MNGYYAGGLARGISNGLKIGQTIRAMVKEHGLQKLREAEMDKAKAASDTAAGNLISEGPLAAKALEKIGDKGPLAFQALGAMGGPAAAVAKKKMDGPVVEQAAEKANDSGIPVFETAVPASAAQQTEMANMSNATNVIDPNALSSSGTFWWNSDN